MTIIIIFTDWNPVNDSRVPRKYSYPVFNLERV